MVFGILAFCFVLLGPLGLILLGFSLSIGHRWKYLWVLSLLSLFVFLASFWFMAEQTVIFLIMMVVGAFSMGFFCPTRFSRKVRISLFIFAVFVLIFYLIILWLISNAISYSTGITV